MVVARVGEWSGVRDPCEDSVGVGIGVEVEVEVEVVVVEALLLHKRTLNGEFECLCFSNSCFSHRGISNIDLFCYPRITMCRLLSNRLLVFVSIGSSIV